MTFIDPFCFVKTVKHPASGALLLNRETFSTLMEARVLGAYNVKEDNQEQPHSSLGYQSPAAVALKV
jgi:hypothetical protein